MLLFSKICNLKLAEPSTTKEKYFANSANGRNEQISELFSTKKWGWNKEKVGETKK